LIRPGERIGADGETLSGASDVDQASITGEPLPVTKTVGDEVFAGTVNGTGMLRVRVDRNAADTVVARIVAMVAEASATTAKTQLFIEKVEQRYSVGVVAATLALFFVPLGFGAALQPTLLRAMTFMIVASPCAVVLATMPPLLSAIANAGRHGVLVKSAVVMEQLGDTTVVAFDKTGTLTTGTPRVTEVHALATTGIGEAELLRLAASAERPSEHPLGRSVVTAAHDRGLRLAHAADFGSLPGRGVHAIVDGKRVAVSSPVHGLPTPRTSTDDATTVAAAAAEIVAQLETTGHTAVVVTVDDHPVGVLGLADQLRTNAAGTVADLTALTGRAPVRVTGDNPRAATQLAERVAITDVRPGLLPQDKVTAVRDLETHGARVLLVGDGVNDAPALAAAHIGVAMGRAGSDLPSTPPTRSWSATNSRPSPPWSHCRAGRAAWWSPTWRSRPPSSPCSCCGTCSGTCRCRSASPATKAPPSSSDSTACGCSATKHSAQPSAAPASCSERTSPGAALTCSTRECRGLR